MQLWIDTRGETRRPDDLDDLRIRLSGPALSRYLVVNLGWAEVAAGNGYFTVRARPRVLSQQTLVSLFYALADSEPKFIGAQTYDRTWEERSFVSKQAFRTFFTSLIECPRETDWLGDKRLLRQRISAAHSPFGDIADRAQMIAANVTAPEGIIALLTRVRHARWSVCRVDRDEQQTIVLAKTRNYTPFNIQFANNTSSTPIAQYADRDYSQWITRTHLDTLNEMIPRYEHVDAIARFSRLGEVRLRYDTLTVPIRLPDGSDILVCGSMDNAGIDLRQSLQQKAG